MFDFIEELIKINYKGEDAFVTIYNSHTEEQLPYGSVTKYIRSLKLRDVDYNALKTAYKKKGADPVRIGKRPVDIAGRTSKVVIEVSKDSMSCYMILLPPREGEQITEPDIILGELKKRGVVYGIQEEKIKRLVSNKIFKKRILAAAGAMPVPGSDIRLNPLYAHNTNLIDLLPMYSTEALYDKFEFFRPVNAGDIIAEIEDTTSGIRGTTIYNESVPTIPGESKEITGSNIDIKGNKVAASIYGRLLFTPAGIEVEPVLLLNYVMDKEIRYNGSIKIMGDVESCRFIQASGDIEVHGVVSNTPMEAGRNIIIHENLLSHIDKTITAGRDFVGRNVFHSNITAENILVLSTVFSSELNASISVRTLAVDGCIVGGYVHAGLSVHTSSVGDNKGAATQISVATPQIMRQFKKRMADYYTRKIDDIKKSNASIFKKIQLLDVMRKRKGEKNSEVYKVLSKKLRVELDKPEREISNLYKEIVKVKDPKMSLMTAEISANILLPNATLAMGRCFRKINEKREKLRFILKEGNVFTELLEEE